MRESNPLLRSPPDLSTISLYVTDAHCHDALHALNKLSHDSLPTTHRRHTLNDWTPFAPTSLPRVLSFDGRRTWRVVFKQAILECEWNSIRASQSTQCNRPLFLRRSTDNSLTIKQSGESRQ